MLASIIVPVYNRKNFIEHCINSLTTQTLHNYEIIIIDDRSTDGTKEFLKKIINPKIKLIFNEKNQGPAYSRNRGIEISEGEYLAFTDSDCIVEANWLAEITKPFFHDQTIMITTGEILDPKPQNYWEEVNGGSDVIAHKEGYTNGAIGCNMACRRNFIQNHKFNETIKLAAAEDRDLCLICLKENFAIYYNPLAKATHHRRSTLRSTTSQQFHYGFWNTYVNVRHNHFPYLNYGTWIMIAATISTTLTTKNRIFQTSSWMLVVSYLILVFYVSARSRRKTLTGCLITFPGVLIKSLADSFGNLAFLLKVPVQYVINLRK